MPTVSGSRPQPPVRDEYGPAGTYVRSAEVSRITVAAGHIRVDLAVPVRIPVATLLPSLLRQVGTARDDRGCAWTLTRVDGTPLDSAEGLDAAGVVDGDLLLLQAADGEMPAPVYDDVVEIIGQVGRSASWSTTHSRVAVGVGLGSWTLVGVAAFVVAGPSHIRGFAALGAAALLFLLAAGLARTCRDLPGGIMAALASALWCAIGAAQFIPGPWAPSHALIACSAAILIAAVLPSAIGGGEEVAAGMVLFAFLTGVGVGLNLLAHATLAQAAAISGAAGLATLPALPAAVLQMARVDRPTRLHPVAIDLTATERAVTRARRLLTGLLTGCLLVVAGSAYLLDTSLGPSGRVLGMVLLALVWLRARSFRHRNHVLVTITAALVGAVSVATVYVARIRADDAGSVPAIGIMAAIFGLFCAVAYIFLPRRTRLSPRLSRALDWVEILLQVAVVPLVLAVWGVYGAMLRITS